MSDRAQLTGGPYILPFTLISILILALIVDKAVTSGVVPAVVGGVAGVASGLAVIALLTWIASHLFTFVDLPKDGGGE